MHLKVRYPVMHACRVHPHGTQHRQPQDTGPSSAQTLAQGPPVTNKPRPSCTVLCPDSALGTVTAGAETPSSQGTSALPGTGYRETPDLKHIGEKSVSLQTELCGTKSTGLMLQRAQRGIHTRTMEGRKDRKLRGGQLQAEEPLLPLADSSELPETQQATLPVPQLQKTGDVRPERASEKFPEAERATQPYPHPSRRKQNHQKT